MQPEDPNIFAVNLLANFTFYQAMLLVVVVMVLKLVSDKGLFTMIKTTPGLAEVSLCVSVCVL